MNVLDLFSGIGGFSLGLERAGFKTVAFCEIDPYCQRVLAKHWPDIPIYDDIKRLTGRRGFADVVCGGFPCQPYSSAARGRNKPHDGLWSEMLRLVSECRPTWVIGENVVDLDRLALRQVVADLEGIGYEVAPPLEIPACAVGHDHRRSRLWIIGHTDGQGQSISTINAEVARVSPIRHHTGGYRGSDGLSNRVDRLKALGNSVVPQIPEIIGRAIMRHHLGLVSD